MPILPAGTINIDNRGLSTSALGWDDLIGDVSPKVQGAGKATLAVFMGTFEWFSFDVGDKGGIFYHVPHNYALGTDLFLHVHWAHNGTNISGTFDLGVEVHYAKGHQQAIFDDPHLQNIVVPNLSLANAPQYLHRIDEIQISTLGGSSTLIHTEDIEPDGIILIQYNMDEVPVITGGSGSPFIFTLDIHYQLDRNATLNKEPNFYGD